MLAAHFFVLGVWLLMWTIVYGWGSLAAKIARCERHDFASLTVSPWIGIGCILGVLQLWNLAAPVNAWAFTVIGGVGILAAATCGVRGVATALTAVRHHHWQWFVLGGLFVAWLANRSLSTQQYPDHGLYYLNTIRWAAEYPIVPGLANLHSRFGFNNSNFLLHAMLEVITGRGYSAHVVNGFMSVLAVPIVLQGFRAGFGEDADARQLGWFTLSLAMLLATSVIDRRVSSATPDYPASLFVTVAVWRLIAIGIDPRESAPEHLRRNLLTIALLAPAAVSMKTTVIFFAAVAGLALAAVLYQIVRQREARPLASWAGMLGFMLPWVAVIFFPWVLRGYILSGYPLFPSTIGGAQVDWAFDPVAADGLRQDIYAWARTSHLNVDAGYQPGWGWIKDWLIQVVVLRAPLEVLAPAAISAVGMLWFAWLALKHRPSNAAEKNARALTAVIAAAYVASIVAWFLTAPSARMGSFAWWGLAATLVSLFMRCLNFATIQYYAVPMRIAVAVLLCLPMIDEAARIELRYRNNPKLPEYGSHFYDFLPVVMPRGRIGFPPLPTGKITTVSTNHGLQVHVGAIGPDGKPEFTWDSPLPSAPSVNPDLMLRRPGDMSSGFRIVPAANSNSPPS